MTNSANDKSTSRKNPRLGSMLRDDLRRGDFQRTMRRDYRELKDMFLDEDRKARLKDMRRAKQWFYTSGWLLKGLILKLTPARRLLVVLAFILAILPHTIEYTDHRVMITIDTGILSALIILFILMLELKDKLLARDELEAGRAVQTALMPERMPEIPGWSVYLFSRTANEVGGDLVDYQSMDNGRYRVTLADVAGKGLKAALLTAKLQATLRAIAPDTSSLAELGERINRIFYRDSLRSTFASLVCAELRSGSGNVRLMNAGHLPPILIRGRKAEETNKGNPGIGILPEISCAEEEIGLQPDDILLFYSDGVTEAKNRSGDFFGLSRLLDILPVIKPLPVDEIGARIVRDVERFIGEERMYDDLSLVIIKRVEAVS